MSYGDLLALVGVLCIVLAFCHHIIYECWPVWYDKFMDYKLEHEYKSTMKEFDKLTDSLGIKNEH